MPLNEHAISWQARKDHDRTHSYIEGLKPIAGSRTEGNNFRASVDNSDLEITVCIFLFKDKTYGLLDVYKESTWPEQLFSSWDILRGLRCRSSWNAGRLGPLPVDYNGVKTTQDHSKVNPYGAICSRATMILRSTVVHGRIGINGALLVLWIADEVHSWWVIEERSHCLET